MTDSLPPADMFDVVHRFISASQAGELTDEQMVEFEQLLSAQPEVADLYLKCFEHTLALPGVLAAVEASEEPTTTPAISPGRWHRVAGATYDVASNYVALSMLISAITMAIIVLSMGLIRPATQPNGPIDSTPSIDFVAEITRTHAAVFDASSDGNFQNRSLFADDKIVLTSGRVIVIHDSGARVVMEGPTVYQIAGKNSGSLHTGNLAALVESPEAIGFAIRTPTATVIDLGTEFATKVGASGQLEVHVFDGKVAVDTTDGERHRITAGNAMSWASQASVPTRMAAKPLAFPSRERLAVLANVQLLAHYTFDDRTTSNVAGRRNHLTAHGDPQFVATDIEGLGDAVSLDGVDDCLICENAVHPLGNDDYTWAMWVQIPNTAGSERNHNLIQWGALSSAGGTFVGFNGLQQRMRLRVNHASHEADRTTNYVPQESTYLHLVGSRQGRSENLYVNGELRETIRYDGDLDTQPGLIVLGGIWKTSLSEPCQSQIADLQIYAGALKASEIRKLYLHAGQSIPTIIEDLYKSPGQSVPHVQ